MRIEEMTLIKVTFPTRGKGEKMKEIRRAYWSLEKRPQLRAAIERVLQTGKEEYLRDEGCFLYLIKPEFPLIPSAMAEPQNHNFLKVSIVCFTMARTLGVRDLPDVGSSSSGGTITLESDHGLSKVNA